MKKVVLLILDGWGLGDRSKADAVYQAATPFVDGLMEKQLNAQLLTHGLHVGLPEGQMGNSEVGHLNIGAGRVIDQDLVRIDKAIANNSVGDIPALQEAFRQAKEPGRKLHIMGLVSKGGIHSSQAHLHHLLSLAASAELKHVFVHAFMDGRDADPKAGLGYLKELQEHMAGTTGTLASMVGRYYAMDRDRRWERIKKAYDLLVKGVGNATNDLLTSLSASYDQGETDEFIAPHVLVGEEGDPIATIAPGDVVICFNYRTDRCREITSALTQQPYPEVGMEPLPLHYVTMTNYDNTFDGVRVLFEKDNLQQTLGEVIAENGKTQLRLAETEKYPHVTYFFSGGRESEFEGERRTMVHSPKVATYDLQPEMSADQVADCAVEAITSQQFDFICINFANPDMVGHTGVYDAIVKALETTDQCAERVVDAAQDAGYGVVIIADHGNPDQAMHADGSPHTAHTTNPVPVIIVGSEAAALSSGILADVAPTVLEMMGLKQPEEMTGRSLLNR